MPIAPRRARDFHQRIQHRGRRFLCAPSLPWPCASKPTQSTAQSTSGLPRICSICSPSVASFDRSTVSKPHSWRCARRSGFMSPTMTHRRAQKRAERPRSQANRPRARDVDGRTRTNARRHRAVITGRENVGQQRQVADLRHGLRLVGELQQVEVGVRAPSRTRPGRRPSRPCRRSRRRAPGRAGFTFRQMPVCPPCSSGSVRRRC